jgi:hypothetical protein
MSTAFQTDRIFGFHIETKPQSSVAVSLLAIVLAVIFGLIATSANLIAIALAAGVLGGVCLLARIDFAVWLLLVGTLIINGIAGLAFPGITKLAWAFSMLGFFLLFGVALSQMIRSRRTNGQPGFIFLLILLMASSIIFSFAGNGGIVETAAGFKRSYQLWGLTFAISAMPVTETSLRRINAWLKFAFVVALLQLPFALFERLILVPKRIGMKGGVVPIDIVSGTFEANLEGGGSSSIMVIMLIIALAFAFSAWKEKVISNKKAFAIITMLGSPLFLGETKIALVLLPIMFVMVFGTEIRRKPVTTIVALVVAGLITALLVWVYFSVLAASNITLEQQVQKAIDYNFGSVGYYDRYSLNRTTATSFWIKQHGLFNPVETMFGHGLGSSYSGAGSLAPGHLSRIYPFMAINLTALSTLLWDTGLLGTMVFLLIFVGAWRASNDLLCSAVAGIDRARIIAVRVSLMCNAFTIFYSNSMLAGMSHEAILALTLGYLAWLVRKKISQTE